MFLFRKILELKNRYAAQIKFGLGQLRSSESHAVTWVNSRLGSSLDLGRVLLVRMNLVLKY